MARALTTLATFGLGACATSTGPDVGLEGLALHQVAPTAIVTGTTLVIKGASFVDARWGETTLHLSGSGGAGAVRAAWPATFVDFDTLTVTITPERLAEVGAGAFRGDAVVDVVAASDHQAYDTAPLGVTLTFAASLTPAPTTIQDAGVIFVNDALEVDGDGLLLGGGEGGTFAAIDGCFTPQAGGGCAPIAAREIAVTPTDPLARTRGTFPFQPALAGIQPGTFTGTVTLVNRPASGAATMAAAHAVTYDLVPPQIFTVSPAAASLGQYVFVRGGGFVGGEPSALTQLELAGTFTKTGGSPAQILLDLIPEFVAGAAIRYVINEDDSLGHALDLRKDTGHFSGTITPVTSYGADTVRGAASAVELDIAPIRQVVYLQFEPAYVEGLRAFGLRAVSGMIRDRVLAVVRAAYAGVNLDFRVDPPTDFALFSSVELIGTDPNNMGLFGYDNSPGKDSGNLRLYDRLGGVNAQTQQDGYPGYGGVFVESMMGFSHHPGGYAQSVPGADDTFDALFDPFRPDQGGQAVSVADLAGAPPVALKDGAACPASGRGAQLSCAVFVLGDLIGGTIAHEIGHSLGLANPYGDGFHDPGDAPNRLMDGGGDRPFRERAELSGQGPGVFCDDEYTYLRMILPSGGPPNVVSRPTCQ
jgi:hypothetical protein